MDEISGPQLNTKIAELQKNVDKYSNGGKTSNNIKLPFNGNWLSYMYIGVPILILILLSIYKPKFVKKEIPQEDGSVELKVEPSSIIMWSVILGGALDAGIYIANYKLKNKS